MKKVLIVVVVLVLVVAGYLVWAFKFRSGTKREKGPKPVALAVSKHSDSFNTAVAGVLDNYYAMTEAFVNWDSANVNTIAASLRQSLDSLNLEELQKDTVIYQSALDPLGNAKAQVAAIVSEPTLAQKRVALNALSENLRFLFIVVKYDRAKLYWQECPMAFGEDEAGFWLSQTDAVRNPYLGLKHPTYKAGMLTCGEPKDTINFMVPDSTLPAGR